MSDDMDDGWYGDTASDNRPVGGTDERPDQGSNAPVQIAPGLWAGDFVNGKGLLGIHRMADPDGGQGSTGSAPSASSAPDWGPTGPVDPYDKYRWMQRLGDQGIAYRVDRNGKIFVYTQPDEQFGSRVVDTVESVPMDGSPEAKIDWNHLPSVYQNIDEYKKAVDYLSKYPDPNRTIEAVQGRQVPVVMIPGTRDRFEPGVGDYVPGAREPGANLGRIYWDPLAGLQVANGGVQSPALQLFHEFGHAQHYQTAPVDRVLHGLFGLWPPDFFSAARAKLTNGYDNREEQANISGLETAAAKFLGEPVRTDHHTPPIQTWSPTFHLK